METTYATQPGRPEMIALSARRLMAPVRDLAMFLLDRDGRIASWNEGVGLILGWEEAEWLGQPFEVVFMADDVQAGAPQAELLQADETGRADDDRWMRRRDGSAFFAMGALTRVRDDGGRDVGYLKVLRDCTHERHLAGERDDERRRLHAKSRDLDRVESVLQERDAELRALVHGVRDYAIFTIDTEGCISSWHQGAELMKGWRADEAIGMPFARLFTEADRAKGRPACEMAMAAEHGEYKGDGQRVRKDGSLFQAAVVLTALRGPHGGLLGYLKMTQDVTERKRLEHERDEMLQQAHSARTEAERASHVKGEFLATVSHELRTPLAAILGWAHVLERGIADAKTIQHGLTAISRNARLQVQLIEDLLDMNRIESGQLRVEMQRVDLVGVIAAAIESAMPTTTAKAVALTSAFDSGVGAVMGDPARLQQVVANLLNNAIKFSSAGNTVTVSLAQAGGDAQIEVIDGGQGMAADFLPQVFDRFQQADSTSTRRHGGLGLGLAIVQHLVKLHGGHIGARSEGPGRGSTFTVDLPSLPSLVLGGSAETPARAEAGTGVQGLPRLDGVRVLLVDDEDDVRGATAQVLQQAGAEVVTAGSADEGIHVLGRQAAPPHVILSDIAMPGADGYELLRRVRALPQTQGGAAPAAAFTAYTRPEDRQQALSAGFQMHLSKPVTPEVLVATVMRLAAVGALPR